MSSQVQNEKNKKIFAERMRAALNAAKLKVSQVARDYGVSQPAVSGWLAGRREPGFDFLAFLWKRYGINPFYIICGEGPILIPSDKTFLEIGKKKRTQRKSYCASVTAS